MITWTLHCLWRSRGRDKGHGAVSVHLHPPFQYEVASDAQQNKEKTQHEEVDEETPFLNVQLLQDISPVSKDTLVFVSCALEWFPVEPIDGEQNPLEAKPADTTHIFIIIKICTAPLCMGLAYSSARTYYTVAL